MQDGLWVPSTPITPDMVESVMDWGLDFSTFDLAGSLDISEIDVMGIKLVGGTVLEGISIADIGKAILSCGLTLRDVREALEGERQNREYDPGEDDLEDPWD